MPKVIADANRDGKFDAADTALTQDARKLLSAAQPDILPGVNLAGEYCILSYDLAGQKITIHQDGTIREVPIPLVQATAYKDYPVKGGDTVRVYITEQSTSTTFYVYNALSGLVNTYVITARGLRGLFQVSPDGQSFTVANGSNLHIFTRSGGKTVLTVPELSIEGKDVDIRIKSLKFTGPLSVEIVTNSGKLFDLSLQAKNAKILPRILSGLSPVYAVTDRGQTIQIYAVYRSSGLTLISRNASTGEVSVYEIAGVASPGLIFESITYNGGKIPVFRTKTGRYYRLIPGSHGTFRYECFSYNRLFRLLGRRH